MGHSGYWHIPMHKSHQSFLGVHWVEDNGSISFWQWRVMFLGISDATYLFTKMLRPHVAFLRSLGIRTIIYIDDLKVYGISKEKTDRNVIVCKWALDQAGWVAHRQKPDDEPSQIMLFLGMISDSLQMKFILPEAKVEKIIEIGQQLLQGKKHHVKLLAKFVGLIQFSVRAVGSVARIMTRSCYKDISSAKSWNSYIHLSENSLTEVSYLTDNIKDLNGHPIRPILTEHILRVRYIAGDASNIGNFLYELTFQNAVLGRRPFVLEEMCESSTYRELTVFADFYLGDNVLQFTGCNIVHLTDSQNIERIFLVGSKNIKFQPIVMRIFLRLKLLNITLRVEWIPRETPYMKIADSGSQLFDTNDFSMDWDSVLHVITKFGPFEIDCMASYQNKKCIYYFAKFEDINNFGCLGKNFFSHPIPDVNLWIMPPPSLIIPVIWHLFYNKSRGTLIIPAWRTCIYWNSVYDDGFHANSWVQDVIQLQPTFTSGPDVTSEQFKGQKQFTTLALRFDFSEIEMSSLWISQISPIFCINNGCIKCMSN